MTDIDRRCALALGGGAALAALAPGIAQPPVAGGDAALDAAYVDAALDTRRSLPGYLVRRRGSERLPGIVVIHDAAGLEATVRGIAMALAQDGFVAFAPDLVSGGTPPDPSAARAAVAALPRDVVRSDAAAAVRWLGGARRTSGGVAILGLGWGGTVANAVAAAARQTARAGVSYYGRVPAGGDRQGGASPLLLHLAGQDRPANRATEGWARGLQRGGAEITTFYYPTARPGFATPGPAYDEAAAGLAWGRTLSFLQRQLA